MPSPTMTTVCLVLPTALMRRFRGFVAEMIVEESGVHDARFDEGLAYAAGEFFIAHGDEKPLRFTKSRLPVISVHSAVPKHLADFVRRMAVLSGLTLTEVWHVVILEFCERSMAPGLEQPHTQQEAA